LKNSSSLFGACDKKGKKMSQNGKINFFLNSPTEVRSHTVAYG